MSISSERQFSLRPSASQPVPTATIITTATTAATTGSPLFSTLIGYFTDCLSLRCSISSPSDVITMAPIRPDINYLQYGQGVVGRLSPALPIPLPSLSAGPYPGCVLPLANSSFLSLSFPLYCIGEFIPILCHPTVLSFRLLSVLILFSFRC